MTTRSKTRFVWLLLALPGIVQLGLLVFAVGARFLFPFDLEWMEGGLLVHADRMAGGDGVFVEPSVEFIPYPYTPLYPALVAALGSVFGISYQVGRLISVVSIIVVLAMIAVAVRRGAGRQQRQAAWIGVAIGFGMFAAGYPFMEGWYDIVRGDMLLCALAFGGLVATVHWARVGHGARGHGRIAAAAALLALAFFAKQTGVLFVATGGALLLVLNWRRVPVFVATAGAIGLGGTWLYQRESGGWFWTHIYEIHQALEFSMERFWDSFGALLGFLPASTAVIGVALIVVALHFYNKRALPDSAKTFLTWVFVYAVTIVIGAMGFAVQWAHVNAYLPALVGAAIACGAAIPAIAACAAELAPSRATAAGMAAALVASVGLVLALWNPGRLIPTDSDEARGHALVERIASIEGEVFVPYHPWYAHLAGKRTYLHRLPLMTLSRTKAYRVPSLARAFADKRFSAIVLNRAPTGEMPSLRTHYAPAEPLPRAMQPRTYSGAITKPTQLWRPRTAPTRRPGDVVLFDFETGGFADGEWQRVGTAFGRTGVTRPVRGQSEVYGYVGRRFATSMHGGDRSIGELSSPPFSIDRDRLTFLLSGGADDKLRVELRVGGRVVRIARNTVNSEHLVRVTWDVSAFRGNSAQLVWIDEATGGWGHINADDFVLTSH